MPRNRGLYHMDSKLCSTDPHNCFSSGFSKELSPRRRSTSTCLENGSVSLDRPCLAGNSDCCFASWMPCQDPVAKQLFFGSGCARALGFFFRSTSQGDTHGGQTAKHDDHSLEELTRRGHPTLPGNLQILKLTIPKTSVETPPIDRRDCKKTMGKKHSQNIQELPGYNVCNCMAWQPTFCFSLARQGPLSFALKKWFRNIHLQVFKCFPKGHGWTS